MPFHTVLWGAKWMVKQALEKRSSKHVKVDDISERTFLDDNIMSLNGAFSAPLPLSDLPSLIPDY